MALDSRPGKAGIHGPFWKQSAPRILALQEHLPPSWRKGVPLGRDQIQEGGKVQGALGIHGTEDGDPSQALGQVQEH